MKKYVWWRKPLAYRRYMRARRNYGKRVTLVNPLREGCLFRRKPGYQECLHRLRDVHDGQRCFILGNGADLEKESLSQLKDEITIGSNEIYELFPKMGFYTTYLTIDDPSFCEERLQELKEIRGPIKIFGLRTAYCAPVDGRTLFMDINHDEVNGQLFSGDCAAVAYAGRSSAYINLQLAFHLGCDPVYLLGVDLDCNRLTEKSDGGTKQDSEYKIAAEFYRRHGRKVFNAGVDGELDIIDGVEYDSLFSGPEVKRHGKTSFGLGASHINEVLTMMKANAGTDRSAKHYEEAISLCHNGKPEAALLCLEKSIRCKPTAQAFYLTASVKKSLGEYAESTEIFQRLICEKDERLFVDKRIYGSSHFHLGEMNFRAGNYYGARINFKKCIEAIPDHKKAAEYLGVIKVEGSAISSKKPQETLVK